MKCKDVNNKMLKYLDGELNQPEVLALEMHLDECDNCKLELNQLKSIYSIVDQEKQEYTYNQNFSNEVISRLSKTRVEKIINQSVVRYIAITSFAAAAVFIGVIIGTVFSNNNSFDFSSSQNWEQLADEYMPEYESNPYQFINNNDQQ